MSGPHPGNDAVETERDRPSNSDFDDPERWQSEMSTLAVEATAHAGEAVRTANHATRHLNDFDHHDLYRLIGEVSTLVHRLPQLIDQAGGIGRHLDADGRIDTDQGSLNELIATWNDETLTAVTVSDDLARHVDRAFSALSAVKANEHPGTRATD